jgi:AcrR family transcriptional regulator
MGVRERRERERQETREKILDAARELFVAEGYEGVSMRKIADKIEYSPTAIYVHFKDKDELFMEVCHEDFRLLAQSFLAIEKIADPIERLQKIGQAYIEFGLKNPNHYRTMFMTGHPVLPETEAAMRDQGKGNPEEDAYEFLLGTVTEALKAGRFREELKDAHLLAQTMWAGVHGVISLQIAKNEDPWVPWRSLKKRAEAMLDGLLTGLLKPER